MNSILLSLLSLKIPFPFQALERIILRYFNHFYTSYIDCMRAFWEYYPAPLDASLLSFIGHCKNNIFFPVIRWPVQLQQHIFRHLSSSHGCWIPHKSIVIAEAHVLFFFKNFHASILFSHLYFITTTSAYLWLLKFFCITQLPLMSWCFSLNYVLVSIIYLIFMFVIILSNSSLYTLRHLHVIMNLIKMPRWLDNVKLFRLSYLYYVLQDKYNKGITSWKCPFFAIIY